MKETKTHTNKIMSLALAIVMLASLMTFSCITASAATAADLTDSTTNVTLKDSDGDGAYEIKTADDLKAFTNLVNSGNNSIDAKLEADVQYNKNVLKTITIYETLTGVTIYPNSVKASDPIGNTQNNTYQGTFDGNGYSISGVYVKNTTYEAHGIFGWVGGTVKNLTVKDSVIIGSTRSGGIVGRLTGGTVENCKFIEGIVYNDNSMTGGVVGYAVSYNSNKSAFSAAKILNCSISDVTFYANGDDAGGIIGQVCGYAKYPAEIKNCTNNTDITIKRTGTTNTYVGGIAGNCAEYTKIENCTNNSNIAETKDTYAANNAVGGIAGYLNQSSIESCVNKGNVNSKIGNVGGIAGSAVESKITGCSNTGNVTDETTANGRYHAGGITGSTETTEISLCFNTGNVTETSAYRAGGITGVNSSGGIIRNCYNLGDISGVNLVGGIAGYVTAYKDDTVIENCYSSGTITATYAYLGGVTSSMHTNTAGLKNILKNNIYDNTKFTGDAYVSTSGNGTADISGNLGLSTAQFKSGEACYILNGNTSTPEEDLVWGQYIGKEDYPVFGGKIVYLIDGDYQNKLPAVPTVSKPNNSGIVGDLVPTLKDDDTYDWVLQVIAPIGKTIKVNDGKNNYFANKYGKVEGNSSAGTEITVTYEDSTESIITYVVPMARIYGEGNGIAAFGKGTINDGDEYGIIFGGNIDLGAYDAKFGIKDGKFPANFEADGIFAVEIKDAPKGEYTAQAYINNAKGEVIEFTK